MLFRSSSGPSKSSTSAPSNAVSKVGGSQLVGVAQLRKAREQKVMKRRELAAEIERVLEGVEVIAASESQYPFDVWSARLDNLGE